MFGAAFPPRTYCRREQPGHDLPRCLAAQVHTSGRFWHATLRLGADYYGPVRVGLRTSVSGHLGQELAPVVPLEFKRERHVPALPTGYLILE